MIDYIQEDGGRADAGFRGSTGDCVVRAIAIASGEEYQVVYDTMAAHMRKHGYVATGNAYQQKPKAGKTKKRPRSALNIQHDVLRFFGFEKVKLPQGARPTYTEAHRRYGNCIVSTTKHMAALVDGALRDLFDGRTYEYENMAGERKAMSVWVRRA